MVSRDPAADVMSGPNAFRELEHFVQAAATPSVSQTAYALGVGPKSVLKELAGLERRTGQTLVRRSGDLLELTDEGSRLHMELLPVWSLLERDLRSAREGATSPQGLLRLIVDSTTAAIFMEDTAPDFLRAHPDITLDVTVTDTPVDIVASGADAGIRGYESIPEEMIAVRLGVGARLIVVGSPDYLDEKGRPSHPTDLESHNRMAFVTGLTGGDTWRFERDGVTVAVAAQGTLRTNSRELLLDAAREGVGLAQMDERLVGQDVVEGRLVAILDDWTPQSSPTALFYADRRHMPAALMAFSNFVRGSAR